MDKREQIYNVYKAEFELIKEQSGILLQKRTDGFNGVLKESGYLIEDFIKGILKKHLPFGYRICSGYIATTDLLSSKDNLIQHDIIIVDDRAPAIYKFAYGDVEIIPAEAVCGVFEVKRTLGKKNLLNALEHLELTAKILDEDEKSKKSKEKAENNRCGPTINICTTAPVYGIISLQHDEELDEYDNEQLRSAKQSFLDIIWSISTSYLYYFALADEKGQEYFAQNTARNQKNYQPKYVNLNNTNETKIEKNFARAITRIETWVKNTSMSEMDSNILQNYFGLS